jgi:hypothetical protein
MMGRNHKQSGEPNGMIDCHRARELFYESDDGALSPAGWSALSLHERSCPNCGAEFSEWRRVRSILKNSRVVPDPGFTAAVMGRIKEAQAAPAPARAGARWSAVLRHPVLQQGWLRSAAAVVVLLALLGGVFRLPATSTLVAHLFSKRPTIAVVPPSPSGHTQPEPGPVGPNAAGGQTSPSATAKPNGQPGGAPAATPNTVTPAVQPGKQPVTSGTPGGNGSNEVLLSKPRVLISTTIEVQVNNLDQARAAALDLAANLGASLAWQQSAQNGSHANLFLSFTVNPGQASALQTQLSGLGYVVQKQTDSQDISANYASAQAACQTLKAEQAAAPESERQQYDNQIKALEQQLQGWDNAIGKQTVILWLMQ